MSGGPSSSINLSRDSIPDEQNNPTLPVTLASSTKLNRLPYDITSALSAVGEFPKPKVTFHFTAIGSAPILRQNLCKISSMQRFEVVVSYLRRTLRMTATESIFVYVNSCFAPALDEVVGNLYRCFKNSKDQLLVSYSMTPAFG
ncbi:Ubiquitin-like protein ATG12 [Golovinomyces cichoracearum]|uniref:Ubiquitin-like protein ATG12 n=1 Tax=Golovinomyces cichoracearum TaxID=62708 RepID=A0A420IZJ8_9PEZI|nr:Ubiquitin-like protein ATG12 [Golovinomyces cichoracearum]